MRTSLFYCTAIFFLFTLSVQAQVCTLGLGGEDTKTIAQVFQLNEEQLTKLDSLRSEKEIEMRLIEDDIKKLFDTQPQSTPEELTTLAEKYKVLKAKMEVASLEYDKKLLTAFNQKQYERYMALCEAAFREPIALEPQ